VTIEVVEVIRIKIATVTVMTIEIVEIIRIRIATVTVMTIDIATRTVTTIGITTGTATTIEIMTTSTSISGLASSRRRPANSPALSGATAMPIAARSLSCWHGGLLSNRRRFR
jgi:hypothetical protein